MKQIGARQEAGRIGGIGPCGRELCCCKWMTTFRSVGTNAARIQDLSMNPQKLAGQCGKLKCCINFETDTYAEAQKKIPSKEMVLKTYLGHYKFFKADILAKNITYVVDPKNRKKDAPDMVTLEARRAFKIIKQNKEGHEPFSLDADEKTEQNSSPSKDILNESLTRFDNTNREEKRRSRGRRKNKRRKDRSKNQSEK